MLDGYPKREPFFAHRFVRVLQKSCAAQDIGRDACLLLTFIAHTEDAARYRGPVRFWNEQLMTTLAFNNRRQLNNCRQKAIDYGWLVYNRKNDRAVGNYFVQIPEQFSDIPDTEIEPVGNFSCDVCATGTVHEVSQEHSLCDSGATRSVRKVPQEAYAKRTESVTPPNPIPVPIPNPLFLSNGETIDEHLVQSFDGPLSGIDPLKFQADLIRTWNQCDGVTKYTMSTLTHADLTELRARMRDPEWQRLHMDAINKMPLEAWPGNSLIPLSSFLKEGCVQKILAGNYDATNKRSPRNGRQLSAGQVFDPDAKKKDPNHGVF